MKFAAIRPLVALAAVLLLAHAPAPAHAQGPQVDLRELSRQASDSTTAASTIPTIRSLIATAPDSTYVGGMRRLLVQALANAHASGAKIAAAADSAVPYLGPDPNMRVPFFATVGQVLADRGAPEKAVVYARRARRELDGAEPDAQAQMRPFVIANLGYVHMRAGHPDSAITYFNQALPATPDSQQVLYFLATQYEKKKQLDPAIDCYVRSLAVFPGHDTTGTGALQAAYMRRYHTLNGLAPRVEHARQRSLEQVALEPRRAETPAPAWKLNDLEGHPVDSSTLAGKIVVLDFWGSWCGPCRMELPLFEALYHRYRESPRVRFLTINWERDKEHHAEMAKQYVTENTLTFPVVIDPEQEAVRGFGVEAFPTVFIIDEKGTIRFRNVGVARNVEDILDAQVQSLMQ